MISPSLWWQRREYRRWETWSLESTRVGNGNVGLFAEAVETNEVPSAPAMPRQDAGWQL